MKIPAVLRTACGSHRFVMIEENDEVFYMPLLPYKRGSAISYYDQNRDPGVPMRKFIYRGNEEYGAFDFRCRVYEEVIGG